MEEEWKDIGIIKGIDWNGYFQVSNYGQIRGVERYITRTSRSGNRYNALCKSKILTLSKDKGGYNTVTLCKEGISKVIRVARVEAIVFNLQIPEHLKDIPIEQLEIDHIDTNRANDILNNIRWTDSKGNSNNPLTKQHFSEAHKGKTTWIKGKHHSEETRKKMSEKHINGKLSKTVLQIDKNTNEIIAEFKSTKDVKRQLGIDSGNISRCCLGKQKTAYGYKWQYK